MWAFMRMPNPWIGVIMSIPAGVLLGLLGRNVLTQKRGLDIPLSILGGIGGFLTGLFFVGLMITSLPINFDKINSRYIYPPKFNVPPILFQAFQGSQFVDVGHDILLYPVLADSNRIPANQRAVYKALHNILVVGQPWERSQTQ
jgi:hypothetical protein